MRLLQQGLGCSALHSLTVPGVGDGDAPGHPLPRGHLCPALLLPSLL